MAYINMDTNRCSMFTNYAINLNPIEGKELATSPKGLLEHITSFAPIKKRSIFKFNSA